MEGGRSRRLPDSTPDLRDDVGGGGIKQKQEYRGRVEMQESILPLMNLRSLCPEGN